MLGAGKSHITTHMMDTFGYVALEDANSRCLNEKSGIYNFGVLLLKAITGRGPVDYRHPPNEGRHPENAKELFNLHHASLRNAIERIFGIERSFEVFCHDGHIRLMFWFLMAMSSILVSCKFQQVLAFVCASSSKFWLLFVLGEDNAYDIEGFDAMGGLTSALKSEDRKLPHYGMADALGGSVIRFMPPFSSFLCLLVRVSSYLLPHEDIVVEISEHKLVIIVEEFGCLLARVYLKREYATEGRQRFDVILGLFVDCLNIFSTLGHSPAIEISYPGLDMQLLLKCTVVGFLLVLCRLKCSCLISIVV
ncbi:hypothetical protein ZIOFF_001227 [Zingiber officinale]|uniref:Uncharacterized protein n=1 Tax=Zingiber officinale TaxID=94328 RepID=A0A8J5LUW4_ZINOF|nr:hypothetical protein ZIOFF_001227 [Zingiber officinale]